MTQNTLLKSVSNNTGLKVIDLTKIISHHRYKVPREDREDITQDMFELLLKHKPSSAGLAYTICKRSIADYWRHKARHNEFNISYASSVIASSEDGNITFEDLLIDRIDYESKYVDSIDSNVLFNSLPKPIAKLVAKRLRGLGLTSTQRSQLRRYAMTTQYVKA